MKFASEEVRTKAVKAYLEGKATSKKLAETFGYTSGTICNRVRGYSITGLQPNLMGTEKIFFG